MNESSDPQSGPGTGAVYGSDADELPSSYRDDMSTSTTSPTPSRESVTERGRNLVTRHPMAALGVAAGAGLALGMVSGRRAHVSRVAMDGAATGGGFLRSVFAIASRIAISQIATAALRGGSTAPQHDYQ